MQSFGYGTSVVKSTLREDDASAKLLRLHTRQSNLQSFGLLIVLSWSAVEAINILRLSPLSACLLLSLNHSRMKARRSSLRPLVCSQTIASAETRLRNLHWTLKWMDIFSGGFNKGQCASRIGYSSSWAGQYRHVTTRTLSDIGRAPGSCYRSTRMGHGRTASGLQAQIILPLQHSTPNVGLNHRFFNPSPSRSASRIAMDSPPPSVLLAYIMMLPLANLDTPGWC